MGNFATMVTPIVVHTVISARVEDVEPNRTMVPLVPPMPTVIPTGAKDLAEH